MVSVDGIAWWTSVSARRHFVRGTFSWARWLRVDATAERLVYRLFLPVRHVGSPDIAICFSLPDGDTPCVFTPPPHRSPHRNADGSLCLWYPFDPREQRWEFEDGLLELLIIVAAHLFREEWWRRTGEWPGPEAPHGYRHSKDGSIAW